MGFRPFVYRIAHETRISGHVQNNMDGVRIFAEGHVEDVSTFIHRLHNELPPLAKIQSFEQWDSPVKNLTDFTISKSTSQGHSALVIPVDAAVCQDCLTEMKDVNDRRYRYPFINCTNCGPRYTIIRSLPYDRPVTTMKDFPLCSACEAEYSDPMNRRHHAQPIACPACGPSLKYHSMSRTGEGNLENEPALSRTIRDLEEGKTVAIKGLGGFHFACDAKNSQAVRQLRRRKKRPTKPFAVMVNSIDSARQFALVSEEEESLLKSAEAPVVVMQKKERTGLSEAVAPGMTSIGLFLPSTPLHALIMEKFDALVMTSGNLSGEPMFFDEEDVLERGHHLVDSMLFHNRKIARPIDDSVMEVRDGQTHFYRRARGFVPDPIVTPFDVDGIIALGAQLKNTFTFGRGKQLFVGPHNGDLDQLPSANEAKALLKSFRKLTQIEPTDWVMDYHPNYPQRAWLGDTTLPIYYVWHHHAHMVSMMADRKLALDEPVIGVMLDGTGYGHDDTMWGFEWLYGDVGSFERFASIEPLPLPGGDQGTRYPWRQASAWLYLHQTDEADALIQAWFHPAEEERALLQHMVQRDLAMNYVSSAGRLFDCVSAILGVVYEVFEEGEAAIKLSEMVRYSDRFEPFELPSWRMKKDVRVYQTDELIAAVIKAKRNGVDTTKIAGMFHETLARMIAEETLAISTQTGCNAVLFSGGTMHNPYIERRVKAMLNASSLSVLTHRNIPCNDGGISLGQALIASNARLNRSK
ncbi:[NiFe] hydrogenase metallocenter assembly protein HypF [Salisediminibacterium beveridgei]|uniref:Carbamoyltransferase n=1 Tax=Salisediminibacterium beveridgei TaxID=632773 RepID=A0A1D7QXD8_9BACI|nr:[NiFe] hydrogenase metallocenter assembly protein HypF [Salisediminibacterium beveridgei]